MHLPSFEDVDPFISQGLVDEIIGREETVHKLSSDGALKGVGPFGQKKQRRFNNT